MQEFGVIKKLSLRDIWPKEAVDFTPWLAQNLQALGGALGMDLERRAIEAPVGDFSLDILAHHLGRDCPVIIENQLNATNHDHLGKLLTYASGYNAGVIIWIAQEIREEHRQAIDWLNQHTDESIEFYGVVIEVIRIDNSRPAYNFKIIASPNEWRKTNIATASTSLSSGRGELYRKFFQDLIDILRDQHAFTKARKGLSQSWYTFPSRVRGVFYGASFAIDQRIRCEIYIDRGEAIENKAVFDYLLQSRTNLETAFGEPLTWERLDNKRACRIAIYRPGSIEDSSQTLEEIRAWMIDHLLKLKQTFTSTLIALQDKTSIIDREHEELEDI
jgi:hypothetical protein